MRRSLSRPEAALAIIGVGCVVFGGLVAAATGPLRLEQGSWVAAYLVLVGGVAQVAMGLAPAWLTQRPTSPTISWSTLASWDLGSALVIAGTLADLPLVVDGGSVLLVIGLATALYAVRRDAQHSGALDAGWLLDVAYRALLFVLLVSIPIGVVFAHLRADG